MLKLNRLNSIAMIFAVNLFITAGLSANWKKTDEKTETNPLLKKQEVSYQNEPAVSKSDSLPEGVTQDWLNSLRDENGNRIFKKSGTEKSQRIPEDPEGDALQRKIFNGLSASGSFGSSISSAGDVNGDGFDDIIAGAPGYSSGTGRAYIYFGGLITNTIADVVLTGEAASNSFGISVSPAGDVNCDGFSDVIVGAIGYLSNTGMHTSISEEQR